VKAILVPSGDKWSIELITESEEEREILIRRWMDGELDYVTSEEFREIWVQEGRR
jgi:hypothetical protein